jgi:dCMP deaminase
MDRFAYEHEPRPDKPAYMMAIAQAAALRADCLGRHVGAVIHLDWRVLSTGYNGTPFGMTNCSDQGCHRCSERTKFAPGVGYDKCICVHAEENAILSAARHGIRLEGANIVSTLQPCLTCLKSIVQAGIRSVTFRDLLPMDSVVAPQWNRLMDAIDRA